MSEEDVVTTINPGEEHWSTSLVGDNAERAEALQQYESPDQFLEAFDNAQDWRRGVAGDDDKYYSELQRFKTPTDYGNSFREAQQTIRSGNLKAALGPDATAEDVQAYREANGIPLEATGYIENLPDGLVLGEQDKEIFSDFAESLHEVNAPPEIAHKALEWYNSFAEKEQELRLEMDADHKAEADRELREAWGADYRGNINLVGVMMDLIFGEEAKNQLLNGRFGDGKAFLNDPGVMQGLADIARRINPAMEVTPPGHDPVQSLNDEIAELEKFMSETRTEYTKDVAKQERLRQLYDIRIKQAQVA